MNTVAAPVTKQVTEERSRMLSPRPPLQRHKNGETVRTVKFRIHVRLPDMQAVDRDHSYEVRN